MSDELDRHRLRLAHQQRIAAQEVWEVESRPIIRRMCDLRSMFTTFRMVVGGHGVESTETWNDPKAEALYHQYEETLRFLRENIFRTDDPLLCQHPKP